MRAPEDPSGSESSSARAPTGDHESSRPMSADTRSVLDRWRDGLHASADPVDRRERARDWFLRVEPLALVRPAVIVVALGVVAIGAGAVAFLFTASKDDRGATTVERNPVAATTAPPGTRADRATGTTRAELVVHAAGAVAHPGLYRLAGGSRVSDVIDAAGGLALDADHDRVNLAAPLSDGGRLYIPRRNETTPPTVVAADAGTPAGSTTAGDAKPPTGPVNINTANASELDTLPGVGPTTSTAIIDYRNQHGPFRSVDDLNKVRGIGKAKVDQLRPLVTT